MQNSFSRLPILIAILPFLLLTSCGSKSGSAEVSTEQAAFDKLKAEKKAVLDKICADLGKLKSKIDEEQPPGKRIFPIKNLVDPVFGLNNDKSNIWVQYYPELGKAIEMDDTHFDMDGYNIAVAGNQDFNKVKMIYRKDAMLSADFKNETEQLNNFDLKKNPWLIVLKNPVYLPIEFGEGEQYNGGGMTIEAYFVDARGMTILASNTLSAQPGLFASYEKKGDRKAALTTAIHRTSRENMTLEINTWAENIAGAQ